jgi:hypothetical protein
MGTLETILAQAIYATDQSQSRDAVIVALTVHGFPLDFCPCGRDETAVVHDFLVDSERLARDLRIVSAPEIPPTDEANTSDRDEIGVTPSVGIDRNARLLTSRGQNESVESCVRCVGLADDDLSIQGCEKHLTASEVSDM